MEYYRTERVNPTPLREQESFFQTWLYFGLIFESVGINANDGGNQPTSLLLACCTSQRSSSRLFLFG
jgi:hypothetical protein